MEPYLGVLAVILGYIADKIWADPEDMPHPVIAFGKGIAVGERRLNRGKYKRVKGAILTLVLVTIVFIIFRWLQLLFLNISVWIEALYIAYIFFLGLAGTTLIKECNNVFKQLDISLEAGQRQVARIVGRETSSLNAQKVRSAALETMAENLSDGVVAPLFWFAIAGIPGMMAYKMINTLDSMIGYKSERYKEFGAFAARLDDFANFIPARITAFLMALLSCSKRSFSFLFTYGRNHSSPNAGFPEAALAGILNARFGGPNVYHGELVNKPFIGEKEKEFDNKDIKVAAAINFKVEFCSVLIVLFIEIASTYFKI